MSTGCFRHLHSNYEFSQTFSNLSIKFALKWMQNPINLKSSVQNTNRYGNICQRKRNGHKETTLIAIEIEWCERDVTISKLLLFEFWCWATMDTHTYGISYNFWSHTPGRFVTTFHWLTLHPHNSKGVVLLIEACASVTNTPMFDIPELCYVRVVINK